MNEGARFAIGKAQEKVKWAKSNVRSSQSAIAQNLAAWSRAARRIVNTDLAGQVTRDVERLTEQWDNARDRLKKAERDLADTKAAAKRAR